MTMLCAKSELSMLRIYASPLARLRAQWRPRSRVRGVCVLRALPTSAPAGGCVLEASLKVARPLCVRTKLDTTPHYTQYLQFVHQFHVRSPCSFSACTCPPIHHPIEAEKNVLKKLSYSHPPLTPPPPSPGSRSSDHTRIGAQGQLPRAPDERKWRSRIGIGFR